MKQFKPVNIFLFLIVLLSSCSDGGGVIGELENCLGETKSMEDMNELSENEAVQIAQCMIGPMERIREKVSEMTREEAEAFEKEYNEALEESEHQEILKELDLDVIKDLASRKVGSAGDDFSEKTGSKDWDKALDSYENYIDNYIELMEQAKQGNSEAMIEYAELMQKANELADNLEKADDDLTNSQMKRFSKLQTKLANAAMEVYE